MTRCWRRLKGALARLRAAPRAEPSFVGEVRRMRLENARYLYRNFEVVRSFEVVDEEPAVL